MKAWTNDAELFELAQREMFTCVMGDVMDKVGRYHPFLPPQIQPLRPDMEDFRRPLEKVRGEKKVKTAIEHGLSACEAFEEFGIMGRSA